MHLRSKWFILIGSLLILVSLGILIYSEMFASNSQKEAEEILQSLEEILPSVTLGEKDDFSSMDMPVLELNGRDIVATVDFPEWAVKLPIDNQWDLKGLKALPQRFSGSVYDDSLIIGGSNQEGSFDCLKKVDLGDRVIITDMTGAYFPYEIASIERKKSADEETLADDRFDLVLFVEDDESDKYIMVGCIS